jgi:Peptidase_C39 like family
MPTLGYKNQQTKKFHIAQVEAVWCWAASVEMALLVHDIRFPKEEIAAICHGRDTLGKPLIRPGSVENVSQFLNSGYFNYDGYHYIISARHYEGLPPASVVKTCVHNKPERPVLFWFQPEGQQLGHLIVCTGVEVDNSQAGNIDMFHVLDPANPNIIGYNCSEICNTIKHTWTVTDVKRSPYQARSQMQHQR